MATDGNNKRQVRRRKATYGADHQKLMEKPKYISITSRCGGGCGGCTNFSPNFPPELHFDIDLEEFRQNVESLLGRVEYIEIHGGEPLLHPYFRVILRMCYSYTSQKFRILTRFRKYKDRRNVTYQVDPKNAFDPNTKRVFFAPLVAPVDFYPEDTPREWYWQKAREDCFQWHNCQSIIFRNKAYFCESAGPMDLLFGEDHGWDILPGQDPFDKSDEEIAEQASHFCYRCGFVMTEEEKEEFGIPKQRICHPTFITRSIAEALPEGCSGFVLLDEWLEEHGS